MILLKERAHAPKCEQDHLYNRTYLGVLGMHVRKNREEKIVRGRASDRHGCKDYKAHNAATLERHERNENFALKERT